MKLRILVGSLLVWGSLPGWGALVLSGGRSFCTFSPSLNCSETAAESASFQEKCTFSPSLNRSEKVAESASFQEKCAFSPSLNRSETAAESASFQEKCAFSPSLNRWETAAESASFQEKKGDRKEDAEQLARALDYFASEKFHECLVLLQPLDGRYKLNPRYRAYLAVCLYYEWEYAEAIRLFDEVLPQLQGLAPHELSLYYWMDAESYFALQQYARALPLYGKMLPLCRDNEKPDAYYRMGFCHLFAEERKKAKECFELSLEGYLKYRNTPKEKARIAQIRHMIGGLK